jgi:pimeloyl-ACP methyl ester carboxylesterase
VKDYEDFRTMTDAYFDDFSCGNPEAVGRMIDFYGGRGTFASWPEAVRDHVSQTTPTNILDWQTAYALEYDPGVLAALDLPVSVAVGEDSHPAVKVSNSLISQAIPRATFAEIQGASHFMITTHPNEVATLILQHILALDRELQSGCSRKV